MSHQLHFQALNRKNQSDAKDDVDHNRETWTLEELFSRRPDLDAVVDLTNTKRYYDPRDMEREAPKGPLSYDVLKISSFWLPPFCQCRTHETYRLFLRVPPPPTH